jgi:hypothetical protein
MSRVYVAVGAGHKDVEKKFVQMMIENSVYVAFMGNSLGEEDNRDSSLIEIHEGVRVNSRRWKAYTKVRSFIESGREVVFIIPEKGGQHFYRGIASKAHEFSVPYLSGTDTYFGLTRAMRKPTKWEREHHAELDGVVMHQVVFPIAGWERFKATDAQKRVMLTKNGGRFRDTFHIILSSPNEFDPFTAVPEPVTEEVAVGGAVAVEDDAVVAEDDAVAEEVAGGGGGGGGVPVRSWVLKLSERPEPTEEQRAAEFARLKEAEERDTRRRVLEARERFYEGLEEDEEYEEYEDEREFQETTRNEEEAAGGGGAAGGSAGADGGQVMTREEKIALYEAMLKVAWMELELQKARGSLELGPIALKIGNLQSEISNLLRGHTDDEDE